MDQQGSGGVFAAGLHRPPYNPDTQGYAEPPRRRLCALSPNADDSATPNVGIDPTHKQGEPGL